MVAKNNPTRPTREQILFGLRVCLRETCYSEEGFEADTFFVLPNEENRKELLDDFQEKFPNWPTTYSCYDDSDLQCFFVEPVEAYFGMTSGSVPWAEIFDPKQAWDLTYGDIADFIAKQLALAVSFEPIVILSKPCQPAGVFLGLEELVHHVQSKASNFGPSTPVRNILHGKGLLKFCEHLHWASIGQIPSPSEVLRKGSWPRVVIQLSIAFMITWLLLGIDLALFVRADAWMSQETWFNILFAAEAATFLFYIVSYAVMLSRWTPLPSGVHTFRDLAMLISNRMQREADQAAQKVQVA